MSIRILAAAASIILGLSVIQAQEGATPTIQTAENPSYGTYLVDDQGYSLYLYLEDSEGASNCYGRCAENWPPLTIEGEPVAGEGVNTELLGTIERDDGATQVAYNGQPLYRYARDREPGDTRGHGLGEVFYLVTPSGERAQEQEADFEVTEANRALLVQLMAEGESIYNRVCFSCHGTEGKGGAGPAFDGNINLSRSRYVVNTILQGAGYGMPAFADQFSDREVAAVATFVRNAWTNNFGLVTEEEVRQLRR